MISSTRTKTATIFVSIFIIVFLLYLFNPLKLINYSFYLLFPLLSCLGAFTASRSYGKNNQHALAILLIAVGILFSFFGEVSSALQKYIFHITQTPYISDYLYAISPLFIIPGLLMELNAAKYQMKIATKLFFIVIAIILAYLSYYFFNDPTYPIWQNIFEIYFRFVQFLIFITLSLLVIIIVQYHQGKIFKPWLYIALGMFANFIGGVLISLIRDQYKGGEYLAVIVVDMTWAAGYLMVAYGFYYLADIIDQAHKIISLKLNFFKK